jgi:V/A-type H+/Na+-transporting ATPase subunit E
MKTLEKGQEKIQKICTALREETLEPAKKEAEEIIKQANMQAEKIIAEAKEQAKKLHAEQQEAMEHERRVFESSLQQAAKQSLESLRQSIESKFFNEQLAALVEKNTADPQVVADLLQAIICALGRDGLNADLTLLIPQSIPIEKVTGLLVSEAWKKLKQEAVAIGNFAGGAKVRLSGKNMTIDISESAIKELMASYIVRKDFRKLMFQI